MDATIPHQSTGPISDQSLLPPAIPRASSPNETTSLGLDLELQSHITSLLPSSQSRSSYSTAVWKAHIDKLSEPERDMFLKHRAGDLTEYVKGLERICKEQGQKSRAAKVARLIKPLFETMNMYAPIARTMIQADPTSSALILGGITCIMSISSRFLDYQEKIVDVLSEMGEKLEVLLEYGSNIYPDDDRVQSSLMVVFGDVLQFCSEVWNIFRDKNGEPRSSVKTFLTSLGKSFEMKFGEILSKFDKDLQVFNERALLCDRREKKAFQHLQLRFMERQFVETRENFSGMFSMGQRMIATANQGWQEEAQTRMQRRIEDAQAKKEQEYQEKENKRQRVLAWLPSIMFHKDQEEKSRKRLEDTGQWLFDNPNFQRWRTSSHSELLWVHGKRGCGKSYLASHVIQDFNKSWEESNIDNHDGKSGFAFAYIYCNSLESTKVDPSKLLGSILKQLCHYLPRPEIETWLEQLYDRQSEVRPPDQKEIKDAIMAIVGHFNRTFLVVDGLDECHELEDDQFRDLCQFVRSLALPRAENSVVKVMAFSRPEYGEIKEAFSRCPSIQIDAGLNSNDIKQFITMKLSGNGFHLKNNPELLAEVERSLFRGADGMFLWVDLVVKALKGQRTAKDIRATVRELPQTLDAVYEDTIKSILEKDEKLRKLVLRTILWITNAKRPLRRDELLEALAVEPGMKELKQEDKILDDDDFASDCADLIVLDNGGYYHLLHSSLKDYLCSTPTVKFNIPAEYRVMQINAEKTLGEICLTYLTFEKFKSGPTKPNKELAELLDENPFLDYASNNWGRHVAAANEIELRDLTTNFLSSNAVRDLSVQLFLLRQGFIAEWSYSYTSTPLHALSIFNLLEIAKSVPDIHSMKAQRDGHSHLPLDHALLGRGRQICNWLLEKCHDNFIPEDQLAYRFPSIHVAALNDWGEVVEMLIAWKYDPECRYGGRQATPLHSASRNGSESAFEALIKAKVHLNVPDIHGNTALIDAARSNHSKLATRLLEEGAEVNLHGSDGFTALHWAARNGNTSLAKLLLQKGADKESINAGKFHLQTPLYVAAKSNCHEILELLFAEHVDIEKKAYGGYNPFLISCERGSLNCVMSLLQAGANIDVRTDFKQTAFHLAAANGQLNILEALFQKRPKQSRELINSVDAEGDTPLHCAIANGHKTEAKFLLEKGALVNKANESECSPLHVAAEGGNTDFISLLLEAGADPQSYCSYSWTAVHHATWCNNLGFMEKLLEAVPMVQLAAKSKFGETPLYLAAKNGFLEFVEFFLERNVNPDIATKHGYTALHAAAESGNQIMVRKLLDAGCDGLYPSKRGETPFSFAVRSRKVEVVNLFLERGFNGCNIPDKTGTNCFHLAAQSGSVNMLKKLITFVDIPSIRQVNCVGQDVMIYASNGGHVEMIDALISLGIPAEGLKLALSRPIHEAVFEGAFDCVSRMIELGANVNERLRLLEGTPFHLATSRRMPLISDMLLKAGASPIERDDLGLSCLDYAIRDPKVWEKMGEWKKIYLPIELEGRMPILRKTVRRTIQAILALPKNPAPENEYERLVNLYPLAYALLAMGAESDMNAARMCFIELASPADSASFFLPWTCNICATKRMRRKWYLCKQCFDHSLCSACYPDYLEGFGMPKSAPKSLRVLQSLENGMKPIREVFKNLTDIGGRFFNRVCGKVKFSADWLDEKAKEYDEWEKSYNDSGRFADYQRPGQKFLKLVEKARKAEKQKEVEGKGETEKGKGKEKEGGNQRGREKTKGERNDKDDEGDSHDTFAAITEELSDLYAEHRPDKEIPDFICSNHEYLEIPDKSGMSETEQECYDANGKLTNEWLSEHLAKYQGQKIDGHADMQINSNKEDLGEPETHSEKESLPEPAQEGKIEEGDGQHINMADLEVLRLNALPAEATETNNTVDDIQTASTPIPLMSRPTDQVAGETAELESKAVSNPGNLNSLSTETSESLVKLEEIKQVLQNEMVDRIMAICEDTTKETAENELMQGEKYEISDKDFQIISPNESEKSLVTEINERTVPLEEAKELIAREGGQNEIADQHIVAVEMMLLEIEAAWDLAQVILVGRVQPSFARKWLQDFLTAVLRDASEAVLPDDLEECPTGSSSHCHS